MLAPLIKFNHTWGKTKIVMDFLRKLNLGLPSHQDPPY